MLGKVLKQYRKKYRITQRSLSRISGVDRDLISRIERGTEKADEHTQALLINTILRDTSYFSYEKVPAWERGDRLGLLLSTLPPEMAERAYVEIIKKLKEYVGFQIDLNFKEPANAAVKRRRKYMHYKF